MTTHLSGTICRP